MEAVTGCETLGKSYWLDAYFSFLQGPRSLQRAVGLKGIKEQVLSLALSGVGLDDLELEVLCSNTSNVFVPKPSIQLLLHWRAIFHCLKR